MIRFQRINTSHEHYTFVEALMQAAFPLQERRDADLQREYADHKQQFHTYIILEKETPIGFVTLWELTDFHYIEHFAIHERYRNKGYGQMVISQLKEEVEGMIILEAEQPTDDITRRRIRFYQRQGFILHDEPYQQPPYRQEDEWLPMKLMTFQGNEFYTKCKTIINTIYKEVYNL